MIGIAGELVQNNFSLGIVGFPLEHTLSPMMHQAALAHMGFSGEYKIFSIYPDGDGMARLAKLVRDVKEARLDGLNITIPYKTTVLKFVDGLSSRATAIGAVNTIYRRDYKVYGDNTDAPGFTSDLGKLLGRDIVLASAQNSQAGALVIGAGGSARAVVYSLVKADWQVFITARRIDQIHQMMQELPDLSNSAQTVHAVPYTRESIENVLESINLIINTTPLGMYPHTSNSPWLAGLEYPPGASVYDLVYNPAETRFIHSARLSGLSAANGLGMLVEQAALSFQLWTGSDAPRKIMRQVAEQMLYKTVPLS